MLIRLFEHELETVEVNLMDKCERERLLGQKVLRGKYLEKKT